MTAHRTAASLGSRRSGETFVVGVTASRLLLIVPLVWGIGHSDPIAVMALLAIVAMDIADGVIARVSGLDGAVRRITDAVIDKIMIHAASIAVVVHEPGLVFFYAPLALRDVVLSAANLWCMSRRNTFLAGRGVHRASSATFALLGLAALTVGQPYVAGAAFLAWIVNYALVPDYLRAFRAVVAAGPNTELIVRFTDRLAESHPTKITSSFSESLRR